MSPGWLPAYLGTGHGIGQGAGQQRRSGVADFGVQRGPGHPGGADLWPLDAQGQRQVLPREVQPSQIHGVGRWQASAGEHEGHRCLHGAAFKMKTRIKQKNGWSPKNNIPKGSIPKQKDPQHYSCNYIVVKVRRGSQLYIHTKKCFKKKNHNFFFSLDFFLKKHMPGRCHRGGPVPARGRHCGGLGQQVRRLQPLGEHRHVSKSPGIFVGKFVFGMTLR